ncbi:hypothetical protein IW261DRAFT_1608771 [Armillaria novae-zelandiae]|uniref:DUF6535 domain-containing protein n=1 Tax=Armillaria novae-zelandiae TaxID=153914 RepID=A0AA39TBD1_9AGAR|nr:hypothetical protein IW261DRAFT_1608771 [Armillaria novae-zelandiae]
MALPHPYHDSNGPNLPNGIPRHDPATYECSKITQKYDEGVCKDWKEEIDTLLVFAGLFSAVATAFLIDFYKWLPNTDSDAKFISTQVQKRINVYWFSGLSLALSSAFTGMLCKQWLRESDATGRTIGWKVDWIISTIPLLLEAALVLLFIGVMELLWRLEKIVAIPFVVIGAFGVLFFLFTTLEPSIQYFWVVWRRSLAPLRSQCPYKLPKAWLLVILFGRSFGWLTSIRPNILERGSAFPRLAERGPKLAKTCSSWKKYHLYWVKDNADTDASFMTGPTVEHYLGRYASWLMRHFYSPDLQTSLYRLFWNSI